VIENHDGILFFGVDQPVLEVDSRFGHLYKRLEKFNTEKKLYYLNMKSGFNPVLRKWEDIDVPMPVQDLIQYVMDNKIQKIYSGNHYLLEKYLFKQQVDFISICNALGVEYIIIDNDPYDQTVNGYLIKNVFNCINFKRLSFDALNQYWDEKYGMDNISYVVVPQKYFVEKKMNKLNPGYGVVVMSNSRIQNVKSMLPSILFFLEHIDNDKIILESCKWFYAVRYLILEVMNLHEFQRLALNTALFNFFYAVTNFVKYITLDEIDPDYSLEIYGDVGWEQLFPDKYQRFLSHEEMETVLSSSDKLYLLLNWQMSWLSASGPIFDAVSRRVPFLSYPAMVHTSDLKGMETIEYHNSIQLNAKIQNINDSIQDPQLNQSIRFLVDRYNESMDDTAGVILSDTPMEQFQGEYGKQRIQHNQLLEKKVKNYIDQKELFIRESFSALFKQSVPFDMKQSKYINKGFVQRLINLQVNH